VSKKKLLIIGGFVVGVAVLVIAAYTIGINLQARESHHNVSDANTELWKVATGAQAYEVTYGYWPPTSDDLGEFVVGPLEATYELDTEYGWILNTAASTSSWRGLTFQPGTPGPAGSHGMWVRP